MRKKKQIYCKCGSVANWYKKGKSHRVLICNSCGMIANNPIPLLVAGASFLAKKGLERLTTPKSPPSDLPSIERVYIDSKDKANYSERVINQVIREERL